MQSSVQHSCRHSRRLPPSPSRDHSSTSTYPHPHHISPSSPPSLIQQYSLVNDVLPLPTLTLYVPLQAPWFCSVALGVQAGHILRDSCEGSWAFLGRFHGHKAQTRFEMVPSSLDDLQTSDGRPIVLQVSCWDECVSVITTRRQGGQSAVLHGCSLEWRNTLLSGGKKRKRTRGAPDDGTPDRQWRDRLVCSSHRRGKMPAKPLASSFTEWEGSLISLASSSSSSLPSSRADSPLPDLAPPPPAGPAPSARFDGATSLGNSEEAMVDTSAPVSASIPASPDEPNPNPLPSSRHAGAPRPLDLSPGPHSLAHYLRRSELSPPGSPASLSSFASAPNHRLPGWGRGRSQSSTSTNGSTSGSGDHHGGASALVMPSMRIDHPSPAGAGTRTSSSTVSDVRDDVARLLVLGRTSEERRALVRLLAEGDMSSDADDLSASLLSTRLSERSSRHASGGDDDSEEDLEELAQRTAHASFWHPRVRHFDGAELADSLLARLERTEALLNPEYPTTQSMADLITLKMKGELEACLMLFSARTSFPFATRTPHDTLTIAARCSSPSR